MKKSDHHLIISFHFNRAALMSFFVRACTRISGKMIRRINLVLYDGPFSVFVQVPYLDHTVRVQSTEDTFQ